MKKIFFSLLAIAAIASCAKTEPTFTEVDSEIKIAPVTSIATKANVTGVMSTTAYDAKEDFKVYAYWANEPAASTFETGTTLYLNDVKFVNKGAYWGGETTYYWPKNGSLRFAAYSPATVPMVHKLDANVDQYTLNGFAYPTNVEDTYDILVAKTSESYTAQTATEKVSVVFEHALSWLQFKLVAASTEAANKFKVKNITINDVNNYGNMTADMNAGTKVWNTAYQTPTAPKFTVYNNTEGATFGTGTSVLFENAVADRAAGIGVIVLPQPTTTVTITFDQVGLTGTPDLPNHTVTVPLTLDGNQPWEAGKKYIYTVTFDLDEILINPSIEEWEEETVPEIDATATEVANQEELQAAISSGKNVRLADNIDLEKPIVVGNSVVTKAATPVKVVLDLNGKTITNKYNTDDNNPDVIVVEEGAELTINGDGTVEAITGTPGYAVFTYGTVTINGGTYKSGIDAAGEANAVIYARVNGKIYVNGGYFPNDSNSAYVLNKRDQDRENTVIEVKGGVFKNFNPGNNAAEGTGTNFLAEGYGSYELTEGVWTVVANNDEIAVNSEAALRDAALWGGNVVLGADITVTESIMIAEGKELTLNLNGHNIKNTTTEADEFGVAETLISYGTLTINGEGTVESSSMAVWARGNANAKIVINGGTYVGCAEAFAKGGRSVAYASSNATIDINGGTFQALAADKTSFANKTEGVFAALNIADNAGNINVYGGTFVKFDPAVPGTEPAAWNTNHPNGFVATGYKSVKDGDNYVVIAE